MNNLNQGVPPVQDPVLRERFEKVYHTLEEALQNVNRIDASLFIPKPCANEPQQTPVLTIMENLISLVEQCAGKLEYETRQISEKI